MATNLGTLAVFLKIDTRQFTKGMKRSQSRMKKWENGIKRSANLAVAGIGAAFAISFKKFIDFDTAMTKSLAIMKNVSEETRQELSKTARGLATESLFAANQLAEGYFFLFSAGKSLAQSQVLLGDVARFAQAGMFDLSTATTLLSDAQKSLGLSTQDVTTDQKNMIKVSDVLVKANTIANASVQQFSEALTNKAGPALKGVGKDIEEGVAVLAAFADQGIKGAEAGTALNIVMRDLQTKNIKMRKQWEAQNLAVFDSNKKMRNLGDIVKDLETKLGPMSNELQKSTLLQLGFADKSVVFIQALLGSSNAIKEYEKELRKAGGTTKKVADKQLNSFSAQFKIMGSNINEAIFRIGKFEDGTGSLIKSMKDFNSYMKSEGFNTLAIFTIEFKATIKEIVTSIMWIGGAIGDNLIDFTDKVLTFNNWLGNLMYDTVVNIFNLFKGLFKDLAEGFKRLGESLWDFLKDPLSGFSFKPMTSSLIKAVNELKFDPLNFTEFKYTDLFGELDVIEKERITSLKNFQKSANKEINAEKIKDAKKELKIPDITKPAKSTKVRIESPIVKAVQKGSAEALRLESQRGSKEDKIEKNTKATAVGITKMTKIMTKFFPAGGTKDTITITGAFGSI